MKIVLFKLSGQPQPNDLLIVRYSAPRGGSTHVMHRFKGGEALMDVASAMARDINDHWMNDYFRASTRAPATLRIECQDIVSDVTFYAEIEGGDTMDIEVEEV